MFAVTNAVKLSMRSLLQRGPMPNPKIRQRLGVHANPATQPLTSDMLFAQPRDELEGRIG
jgi:hypothetical protein